MPIKPVLLFEDIETALHLMKRFGTESSELWGWVDEQVSQKGEVFRDRVRTMASLRDALKPAN